MGSATTRALATSAAALSEAKGVTLGTAGELLTAAALLDENPALSSALADPGAGAPVRQKLSADVFASFGAVTRSVIAQVAAERWSSPSDLVDAVGELGIRAAAIAAPETDIEGELFAVTRIISGNPELELALGSRLGDGAAKAALVEKLLGGRAGAATTLIVSSLVQHPRGRRVHRLLNRAMRIVSAQRDRLVATVQTATALSDAQATRLRETLTRRYGSPVALNVVLTPALVGGLRVQIGDDVIDGSVAARLSDLRLRLAG
ncbi:F0F1 ATP synthase subunit delta [Microbacterium sp.]|uniref:F0F1 ATP synthase subunit delta n=1 Tax=Microbacterium sp. TaxID=51671 RepID=UPI0039E7089A